MADSCQIRVDLETIEVGKYTIRITRSHSPFICDQFREWSHVSSGIRDQTQCRNFRVIDEEIGNSIKS